jgi:hypothetical protein
MALRQGCMKLVAQVAQRTNMLTARSNARPPPKRMLLDVRRVMAQRSSPPYQPCY